MKKTIPYITVTLLLYFTFSFVKWQFNPSVWTQDTRAFLVFMWVGCIVLIPLIQKMMEYEK
jgi:hypothetical protein